MFFDLVTGELVETTENFSVHRADEFLHFWGDLCASLKLTSEDCKKFAHNLTCMKKDIQEIEDINISIFHDVYQIVVDIESGKCVATFPIANAIVLKFADYLNFLK